ncbi:MAG: hypothetical protein F7C35_08990 [Desulfurococcales archaeon]|nr:hypothetical protein [Desulfurococcales archaeon]
MSMKPEILEIERVETITYRKRPPILSVRAVVKGFDESVILYVRGPLAQRLVEGGDPVDMVTRRLTGRAIVGIKEGRRAYRVIRVLASRRK